MREAERWRSRAGGASVADLAEPGWERRAEPGALLAYAGPSGARIAWLRQCRGAAAAARAEGRALLVRLDGAELERESEASLAGCDAHRMAGSAFESGRRVRFESVTRVGPERCVDDFVLVAADPATERAVFERWWTSFSAEGCG